MFGPSVLHINSPVAPGGVIALGANFNANGIPLVFFELRVFEEARSTSGPLMMSPPPGLHRGEP